MYDDFSLPYMHQKPIFSLLSCSLQAPERISGKNNFLQFFTQRVVCCFVCPTCCVSSNLETCRQLMANPNEYVFVLENREGELEQYVKNDILMYSSTQLRTCPRCRTFSEQTKNRIFWRQGHFCWPVAHSFLEDSYFSCRACFSASNP